MEPSLREDPGDGAIDNRGPKAMSNHDHTAPILVVSSSVIGARADGLQVRKELCGVLRADPVGGGLAAEKAGPVVEGRWPAASALEGLAAPAQIDSDDAARSSTSDACRLAFQKGKSFQDLPE